MSDTDTNASPPLDVPPERRPRHVAIIMDGNGRWARQRGLPRIAGHQAGARSVRAVVTEAAELGLDALTLYSFSSENWKRPAEEVNALMALLLEYLARERQTMLDNGIRFRHLGRRQELSDDVLAALDDTVDATSKGDGLQLVIALNYGSRAEITDAARRIAERAVAGELDPATIDEATVAAHLYTPDIPDPDLLIRTAGEMRLSNYLLWQLSYAEIHVCDEYWPEFGAASLRDAIRVFAGRERRYGALPS